MAQQLIQPHEEKAERGCYDEEETNHSNAFSVNNSPISHVVTDPNVSRFFKSARLTAAGTWY